MGYIVKVPFIDKEDRKTPYLEVGAPYPKEGRKKPPEEWLAKLSSADNAAGFPVIEISKGTADNKPVPDKSGDSGKGKGDGKGKGKGKENAKSEDKPAEVTAADKPEVEGEPGKDKPAE